MYWCANVCAMGVTRNCNKELFDLNQNPDDIPAAIRKLQAGGSGSRQTSGLADRRLSEVTSNSQWHLSGTTDNHSSIHLREPGIPSSECSHSADNPRSTDSDLSENVIVCARELRQMISHNTCCMHCNKSIQSKNIDDFLQFCDDNDRGCRDLEFICLC